MTSVGGDDPQGARPNQRSASPRAPRDPRGGRAQPHLADAKDVDAPLSIADPDVKVVELRQNLEVVKVETIHDKLVGHLQSFERGIELRYAARMAFVEFLGLIGVALALGVPLFTANFQSFGPFSSEALKGMCGATSAGLGLWSLERLTRGLRIRFSAERKRDHSGVEAATDAIEHNRDFPASS